MIYVQNGIPDNISQWKLNEVIRLRESFLNDTYVLRGVLRWKSNKAPVPMDIFRDAYCTAPSAQADACEDHTSKAITEYLDARQRMTPEQRAEEMFEARAAHGPGVTLINIISGQTLITA